VNSKILRCRRAVSVSVCLVVAHALLTGPATAATDPPPEAVVAELPFLGDEPNRVYIDLAPKGSSRPFRLMLDTGATETVMTPRVARALGVKVRRLKRDPYRRKTLLGRDLLFYIDTRRSDTASRTGWEYGLLGGGFMKDYVVEIDFPARRVRFLDRKRFEIPESVDGPGEAVLPLTIVSNRPGLEVEINGKRRTLLLDTGAPLPLLLSGEIADGSSVASRPIPGFQAAGTMGKAETELGVVKHLRIGPFDFEQVPAVVAPKGWYNIGFPGDSVLGYDVLAQFVVRIDYPRGRLWLRQVAESRVTWLGQPWSEVERVGAHLSATESKDAYRVELLLPGGIADRRGLRTGDVLPTSDPVSELAARIEVGAPLSLIRPGRKLDHPIELPAWSPDADGQSAVSPE